MVWSGAIDQCLKWLENTVLKVPERHDTLVKSIVLCTVQYTVLDWGASYLSISKWKLRMEEYWVVAPNGGQRWKNSASGRRHCEEESWKWKSDEQTDDYKYTKYDVRVTSRVIDAGHMPVTQRMCRLECDRKWSMWFGLSSCCCRREEHQKYWWSVLRTIQKVLWGISFVLTQWTDLNWNELKFQVLKANEMSCKKKRREKLLESARGRR